MWRCRDVGRFGSRCRHCDERHNDEFEPGWLRQVHERQHQVWSLTQFYSVKKCVFNKCTIKVCVSCSWRCPGTFALSGANLTVSLNLCSSGSNTPGKLRALEGRRGSSISLWRVWDRNMRVAGRNGRNGVSRQEVIDLPSRQINLTYTKCWCGYKNFRLKNSYLYLLAGLAALPKTGAPAPLKEKFPPVSDLAAEPKMEPPVVLPTEANEGRSCKNKHGLDIAMNTTECNKKDITYGAYT